jgi:hypothetical protein
MNPLARSLLTLVVCSVVLGSWSLGAERLHAAELTIATFRADVTPPLGNGPCVGCMPKVTSVEHPLELKGLVLTSGLDTYVIAAIDFCGLCNSSDEAVRDALAVAAGTTRERVALQSLHQHSAPILDAEATAVLYGPESEELRAHQAFTEEIGRRAAEAIKAARNRARPVTLITASSARVDRFAANRRVPQADGSIAVRASFTGDPAVRDAPEGLIDPFVRTVTFFGGTSFGGSSAPGETAPLAQCHYYASHPQSFYGDGRVSWDTVGMARSAVEGETGVFQVYFTGCGGNVTVGKYNTGTRASREALAQRLRAAMTESATRATTHPDRRVDVRSLPNTAVEWKVAPIRFTQRNDGAFAEETRRSALAPERPFSARLTAAMFTGFLDRLKAGYVAQATRLRIAEIDLVHLPGEPFVEFQLFAQEQAREGAFVCVAGYGECGVWYYGPDRIYTDRGGYEQTWSVTSPCEETVKTALLRLLK